MIKETADFKFKNIYSLLSNSLEEDPQSIAVAFEDVTLTYKELHEKSAQLANHLIEIGAVLGTVIGLSLINHPNLIIGILGILKAGGVYLPLDPEYQDGHLDYILQDANPAILLTESRLINRFNKLQCKILALDTNSEWKNAETHFDELPIQLEQVAYIVYTSGSTGRPKGIMLTYASLPHCVLSRKKFYLKNPTSLMLGSIGFDPSILMIFYTLSFGGKICLPNNGIKIDIDYIIYLIDKFYVNVILCVPSLYLAMLKRTNSIPSLEQVSLVGESIPNYIPTLHSSVVPNAVLYNEYGPSEYAIGGTLATIFDAKDRKINEITIGKPLEDILIYVLDQDLNPCPVGVKGEIFIGGQGLAKGYLNKQSLTDEKFFFVSIDNQPSVRLYRTGDFGCVLPDGNIDFLGRIDYQVKILGHRIELGAIEHNISQFPGINEVVVIVKEYSFEEKKIIAYFSSYENVNTNELRVFLNEISPKYMIPPIFVQVTQFPLTSNGKIDRKALPSPDELPKITTKEACTELEEKLLQIWQSVLKLNEISIHDNFFDVGGDSILVLNIQDCIKSTLNISVHITDLFQYSTISQLATYLSEEKQPKKIIRDEPKAEKRKNSFNKFKKPENHE